MCACRTPVHWLMPQLIDVYVGSLMLGTGHAAAATTATAQHRNERIGEDELASWFSGAAAPADGVDERDRRLTSRLLLLYYVLLYEDTRCNGGGGGGKGAGTGG